MGLMHSGRREACMGAVVVASTRLIAVRTAGFRVANFLYKPQSRRDNYSFASPARALGPLYT